MEHYKLECHESHFCPEAMTSCGYCGNKIQQKLLGTEPMDHAVDDDENYSAHYQDCTQMPVLCDYHEQGCADVITREELDAHYTTHGRKHAQLLASHLKQMHAEKEWHLKEMQWEIPGSLLRDARPAQRFIRETPRTRVGPYQAFLRLTVTNGQVRVFVCTEETGSSPLIAGLKIAVVRNNEMFGRIFVNGPEPMRRDGGSNGTFSAGGILRYCFEDATINHLLHWSSGDQLTIRANFRLENSSGVIFRCTTSLTTQGEYFWNSLEH